jgi:uncharacterized alkaline shock family protein YloU
MSDAPQPRRGKTTIAPDVLVTIARLSALSVAGVARMSTAPIAVDRLFQRHAIQEMVGMQAMAVNVFVDDLAIEPPAAPAKD